MERQEIESKVIKCVADSLAIEVEEINSQSRLINDLGADSLDFMDIMFHIEDEFKIKMQREDLDFLARIDMEREEAVIDDYLTMPAKQQLKKWLPELTVDAELKPAELSRFLNIEAMTIIIETALTEQLVT